MKTPHLSIYLSQFSNFHIILHNKSKSLLTKGKRSSACFLYTDSIWVPTPEDSNGTQEITYAVFPERK